jgi:acyl dehydratase
MTGPFSVGQTFSKVLVEDLKRTQLVQYAGASGDFNPLHTDDVHAREVAGFPGVFAHGMLTMAMTGSLLTDVVGIRGVERFGGRFMAQVWPGDRLTVRMEITAVTNDRGGAAVELSLSTRNQDEVEVFSGTASAHLEDYAKERAT